MRRLLSLRVTQTALFVAVVAMAVTVLATWVYGALSAEVSGSVRAQQIKDASAIAEVISPYFPVSSSASDRSDLRDHIQQFGSIFGDDVRVFDATGVQVESHGVLAVPSGLLAQARLEASRTGEPYSTIDLAPDGLVLAAVPVFGRDGAAAGTVVVANRATLARQTLDTVRVRLTIATLVTLLMAALIGFVLSDFIARQARRLVLAADDIAAGDFSRRLPPGPFPGEIRELADAFNRMAAQLGEAFETLRGQERAQREFVANASHELRTPIAALKGAIEILETGGKEKPEVRDEFLATMRHEANRLQRLVDNLFTLAQVDSGRLQLSIAPQPADEIAWVVTTAMRPLANEAGVALEADLPTGGATRVLADRDHITQVLLGFVDNAVKHSKPGDVVRVSVVPHGERLRFSVTDTGPGIPPEVLPHIFDRFYTQRKSAEGHRRGSGLGLAIAEEIVEAHGSRIEVDSRLGEGTTFSFELPVAKA